MTDNRSTQPEVVLRLRHISKSFGNLTANDDISFDLRRGEVIALLGENGAGKTTLMNILFGHYIADNGDIEAFGKTLPPGRPRAAIEAGIGMVHQHFTLADNLSVLDNIALGTESLWRLKSDRSAARKRILDLAQTFGLAVDPDARIADLSVGERQRVEILKALYRDAKILILDEPTAVLTPQETNALFDTLRRLVAEGLSVIFISHKLYEVLAVSHRVLVLRSGKLAAERETSATSREELAELMVGRPVTPPRVTPQQAGAPVWDMAGVTVRGKLGQNLLDDASLTLHAGEIIGIAGVSGNGQSSLADLISGLVKPESGQVTYRGRAVVHWHPAAMVAEGIARIPEDRHAVGLVGDMSVAENVIAECYRQPPFSKRGLIDWSAARDFAQRIIRDYEVKCPSPQAITRLLSGGNMQKLILGRVLSPEPVLVLANQPTRGLDIGAVTYVHQQLLAVRQRGGAVLLISEDLDEVLALSDRVVVMYHGRLSAPMKRDAVNIQQLGLMMAGHEMRGEGHAA